MGIHVIQSQSIEVLVQGILQSATAPSNDPFSVLRTQHFIVPSPAIQEWLTQRLAEQRGVSANTEFHQRIRGFQWYAYKQVLNGEDDRVGKANVPSLIMKWRVYQTLKDFIQTKENNLAPEHPLYPLIQRIYDAAAQLEHGLEKQQKKQGMLYWVAEQVSLLFNYYMVYRGQCQRGCRDLCTCPSNWLGQWGRGQALNIEQQFLKTDQQVSAFRLAQAQELEQWQRWLWMHIFHEDFAEMQMIDTLFWQVFDHPQLREDALKNLPEKIVVFTLLELPPQQLNFLRRLGQYLDVIILHYNPSQEYWADSVDPNWKKRYDLGVKARFIEKNPKATDADLQRFFDEFTLNFNAEVRESRHPLLTRFGKQARDHFSLLSQLSSGEEGQWIDAFVNEEPKNLLSQLQSDILYLIEPQEHSYPLDPKDQSIQIHVCHSTLRQLEVLKEQLIHWLAQGTPEQPRRPSDILVLTPHLTEIEPLIRSVFPHIPHQDSIHVPAKIAGVTQLDVENAWRAILGRIEWSQGRFSIEDFSDWLTLEATQLRYGLDVQNTERMLELLIQAGFKRGFDAQHLQQTLSEDDQDFRFSFKFALDRLALGVAIPTHAVFEQTLSYQYVRSSDFELIGQLIEIYQDFSTRRYWLTQHESGQGHSVEEWLGILIDEVNQFIHAKVDILKAVKETISLQQKMLRHSYLRLEDQQQYVTHLKGVHLPLTYVLAEIHNALSGQLEQTLPTGDITFSQIGQIRPLPYKLVVILNLDSGKFPNRNQHIPFDLMELLRPQLGDRSRLEDDQGAFLDSLLLAQDALWLFYNGFDVNDGEVRDPSSVLQELVAHLQLICEMPKNQSVSASEQVIEIPENLRSLYHIHQLQPFEPRGFVENSAVRYQDQWYKVAKYLQQSPHLSQREAWVNTPYPAVQESMTILEAGQWIQDLTFPARLYLKTLGVQNLKAQDLPAQSEPLVLDGLARYQIRDYLQQQDEETAHKIELLQDQLPVGKVQQSAWQISIAEQNSLKERLAIYTNAVTETTQRQWRIEAHTVMNITVPQKFAQDWVSLDASSGRAKRRTKVWLEYLLWLNYLNLGDEQSAKLRRVAVFSDVTVINTGVTSQQAKRYIDEWFKAYLYAQSEPLVLPAALLLLLAEKSKTLEWSMDEQQQPQLDNIEDLLKEWNKSDAFLPFALEEMEWSKKHYDWQFILQEQDTTALLKYACEHYAYALYQPIYQYQSVAEE